MLVKAVNTFNMSKLIVKPINTIANIFKFRYLKHVFISNFHHGVLSEKNINGLPFKCILLPIENFLFACKNLTYTHTEKAIATYFLQSFSFKESSRNQAAFPTNNFNANILQNL